jgi:hypothetical protein
MIVMGMKPEILSVQTPTCFRLSTSHSLNPQHPTLNSKLSALNPQTHLFQALDVAQIFGE